MGSVRMPALWSHLGAASTWCDCIQQQTFSVYVQALAPCNDWSGASTLRLGYISSLLCRRMCQHRSKCRPALALLPFLEQQCKKRCMLGSRRALRTSSRMFMWPNCSRQPIWRRLRKGQQL